MLVDESLIVARLPSLIAGSLLVVAVFLWTRAVAGNFAARIAALQPRSEPNGAAIRQAQGALAQGLGAHQGRNLGRPSAASPPGYRQANAPTTSNHSGYGST